jgi:hypothetical protein
MRMIPRFLVIVVTVLLVSYGGAAHAIPPADGGLSTGNSGVHVLFTQILSEYVRDGRVDYGRLCKDDRLETYVSQLAATNPDAITDAKARLAFWINAYNAYTLKVICDNYPVESINDLHFGGLVVGTVVKKTIWDKKLVVVGGGKMSLNHVEHKIVRPEFKDPRAHFALVCAAKSCPPLRAEAYEGASLDDQLDDQGRIFFGEPDKNRFDVEKKIAYLSKILDWYKGDFGKNDEEILLAIIPFLAEELAGDIDANPGAWDIKHTKYDWSLNN